MTPLLTIGVECVLDGSHQVISLPQLRVVYFPTNGDQSHIIFLCPGCSDSHRYQRPIEVLDNLRAHGALHDYPEIPDTLTSQP